MTFQEWTNTGRDVAQLSEEIGGQYAGCPGREYVAGFMVKQDDGSFMVPMPQDEPTFSRLDIAEEFLWRESIADEINAA